MDGTPNSKRQLQCTNYVVASKAKQAPDHPQGLYSTPLKSHYPGSDPRANGAPHAPASSSSSSLMVVKRTQNQNGLVTGPFTPPSMISSPRYKSTPASSSWLRLKNITPNNRSKMQQPGTGYNPFEVGIIDSLSRHVFSPNVFRVPTPDKQRTPKFQWSIDDIAILKPTDIDEMPSLLCTDYNPELEEVAQRAIDEYFSSQVIAPSPWSNGSKRGHYADKGLEPSGLNHFMLHSPMVNKKALSASSLNGCSQTDISIPPGIDFDLLAGSRFRLSDSRLKEANSIESEFRPTSGRAEEQESEGVNTSLRRKLFFHHHKCHPSPFGDQDEEVKELDEEEEEEDDDKEEEMERTGLENDMEIVGGLQNGMNEHFASSPIQSRSESPHFRRSSTEALQFQFFDSPEMSPISGSCIAKSSMLQTPVNPMDISLLTPIAPRTCIPDGFLDKNRPAASSTGGSNLRACRAPVPSFMYELFRRPSEETGMENLGIEDHGRSLVGSHQHRDQDQDQDQDTLADAASSRGRDLRHADTGYQSNSNDLGASSYSCYSYSPSCSNSLAGLLGHATSHPNRMATEGNDMSGLDDDVNARFLIPAGGGGTAHSSSLPLQGHGQLALNLPRER